MIFTDRTIIVQKGTSSINDTIVLYRGDKEVEIRFTLNEGSPFRFGSGASPNIIEKTEAAYGQLIIKRPNDLPAVFSEIAPTNEGKIVFTITAEMIDEITEVGNYTFQIRLLDESRNSRATLPEVVDGIEIREPIDSEDRTNVVGLATVGYALTTAGAPENAFDSQGNYNKTTWAAGDRITDTKLNKIEDGIDEVNRKVANVNNINDTTASATTTYSSNKIENIKEELSSQIKDIDNKKANITTTQDIQQQVNNLVLGAVGDGNNAEVVQARGIYDLLNDRLDMMDKHIYDSNNMKYDWKWAIGGVSGTTGDNIVNNSRIRTDNIIYADKDIKISLNDYSLYKFGIIIYADADNTSRTDTGWRLTDYIISAGSYFKISIAPVSGSTSVSDIYSSGQFEGFNARNLDIAETLDKIYKSSEIVSRDEEQYASNNVHSLDYYGVISGNINGNTGAFIPNTDRIRLKEHIYMKKGTRIFCNNTFLLGYANYGADDVFVEAKEGLQEYFVPKDGYYSFVFYKKNYAYETDDIVAEIVANCFIIGEKCYDNDDICGLTYFGEKINTKPHKYAYEKLFDMSNTSDSKPPSGQGTQGMAISNNVLFQLWGNGFVELYDVLSGDFINAYNITSEHGDCAQFGNTKYAENDEFSLLYITSDTTPAKIYINRVTRTSAELIQTLFFPSDKTGYYSGHVIDFEKNIAYQIGYKNNSYASDDGTNGMIVSSWDLANLTDNGDGTCTPAFLNSFNLPFFCTVQGQKFYDGKIYIISSHHTNTSTVIYGIDIINQRVCTTIKNLPASIKSKEVEDLEFWYDEDNDDYKMILSVRPKAIYKLSFE